MTAAERFLSSALYLGVVFPYSVVAVILNQIYLQGADLSSIFSPGAALRFPVPHLTVTLVVNSLVFLVALQKSRFVALHTVQSSTLALLVFTGQFFDHLTSNLFAGEVIQYWSGTAWLKKSLLDLLGGSLRLAPKALALIAVAAVLSGRDVRIPLLARAFRGLP